MIEFQEWLRTSAPTDLTQALTDQRIDEGKLLQLVLSINYLWLDRLGWEAFNGMMEKEPYESLSSLHTQLQTIVDFQSRLRKRLKELDGSAAR